jgi:hypothetical protein
MVVQQRAGQVLRFWKSAALSAGLIVTGVTGALADGPMVTKEPAWAAPASGPAACSSVYDFFLTSCPLTWSGVTFYGTVDMGGSYMTHGTPFDPNFPTGAGYLIGAGGTGATGRINGFFLAPNGMSQSVVGMKTFEPIAPGWNFVSVNELAFDPYSLLLANAPQAMQDAKNVPINQQAIPADSSRWGWLAGQNAVGINSPVYGTLTFGRQNTLYNDAIVAYDPMGAAYAFSPIGFSGKAAGGGDTEDARWTTAIKYRENIGPFRFAVMGQPVGGPDSGFNAYNPNNGAIGGSVGGDIKNWVPGVISVDVLGVWEKDAVNIAPAGQGTNAFGVPVAPFVGEYLKATLSNQTSVMAVAKWSFGSWGNTAPPIVGKAPPVPSGPSGIPLTLYAGYEWIQFAEPSDPQTSFLDDGFLFMNPNTTNSGGTATANLTAINNNAFNASCSTAPAFCTNETFQIIWAGAKYGITKDLDIIGAYYKYIQNQYIFNPAGTECAIASDHSQCAGSLDVYSLVLDWRFLPKWDWYTGFMYSVAGGGISNGDLNPNNFALTSGVRFRF